MNVLSKIDLLPQYDIPFNLDFYTDTLDLKRLVDLEGPSASRFGRLNAAICELVDDFGLVGFETLDIADKESALRLLKGLC